MSERYIDVVSAIRISIERIKAWANNKFATKKDLETSLQSTGGVQSDWLQNDETAPDYIKNRTHYKEVKEVGGDTLSWDGNTEGRVSAGNIGYKVSDAVPSKEDFANGFIIHLSDGSVESITDPALVEEYLSTFEDDGFFATDGIFVVPYNNYVYEEINFPEAGIYFTKPSYGYITSFTIPGYTGFKTKTETVKTLDYEYLPEALHFGTSFTEEGDTLSWDGSTNTLCVMDYYFHVSDAVVTVDDIVPGMSISYFVDGEEITEVIDDPEWIEEIKYTYTMMGCLILGEGIICIDRDDCYIEEAGFSFPKKGVYFCAEDGFYVNRLTIPGYGGFKGVIVNKLDKKYLPTEVVSDWNQNNPDALNYVKNRTHYAIYSKSDIVMGSFEITPEGDFDLSYCYLSPGGDYEVVWNGEVYNLSATAVRDADGVEYICLGNRSHFGLENTGEPFVIYTNGGFGKAVGVTGSLSSVVVEIYRHYEETVKKLDNKYIDQMGYDTRGQYKTLYEGYAHNGESKYFYTYDYPIKVGSECKVTVDGVLYKLVAKKGVYESTFVGNDPSVYYDNPEYPFSVSVSGSQYTVLYSGDKDTAIIKIEVDIGELKKIDSKFIPGSNITDKATGIEYTLQLNNGELSYDIAGDYIEFVVASWNRYDVGYTDDATQLAIPPAFVDQQGRMNKVVRINSNAFSGCALNNVVIPDTVDVIGSSAFSNMSNLTTVYLGNGVVSVENHAFLNCTNLKSIIIPKSLLYIESHAFDGCTALSSLTIPDSVKSVNSQAFQACTGLTDVKIYGGSLSSEAFKYCSNLTSVTIGSKVTRIDSDAFRECNKLSTVYFDGSEEDWNKTSFAPYADSIFNYAKIVFKYSADNGTPITDSVTGIEYELKVDNGVVTHDVAGEYTEFILTKNNRGDIGYNEYLTEFDIPSAFVKDGVTYKVVGIDADAFYSSSSPKLTSVTIPNTVTSIGDFAFSSCGNLTSVTISGSVISLGQGVFQNCFSLKSVTICDGVTSIGEYMFYGCSQLTDIVIPNSVTTIQDHAFQKCSSLSTITIPHTVTHIGDNVFSECSKLTNINIPNDVVTIGGSAFSSCTSLTSIVIPNNVTTIGINAFSGCTNLTSVVIPDSVITIGWGAFASCTQLSNVVIGSGVTNIDEHVFNNCGNLTHITVPNSVTNIASMAFSYCRKIATVYFEGTEDQWGKITVGSSNEGLTGATILFKYSSMNAVTLISPDGSKFKFSVDNSGALTATKI